MIGIFVSCASWHG